MPTQNPHPVSMDQFRFSPPELTIKVGETVEWTNRADPDWHSATHMPTAAGEKPIFDSPDLNAGDPPFSFTFYAAGEYDYKCRNHDFMRGKIKVE
jgi:plastocyanin